MLLCVCCMGCFEDNLVVFVVCDFVLVVCVCVVECGVISVIRCGGLS